MQKLMLLLILAFLIVSFAGCFGTSTDTLPPLTSGGISVESDEFFIGEDQVTISPLSDVYLNTEYGVDLAFNFALERSEYDYLVENFPDLEVRGRYMEYNSSEDLDYTKALPAEIVSEKLTDEYAFFSISVGGVISDKYNTDYITLLELNFTDPDGELCTIRQSSPVGRTYNVAFSEYINRSKKQDDIYCYSDGEDAYTPYSNLSIRRTILYSTLHLSVKNGAVTDLCADEYYTSPYILSYFDGIVTIEMANGASIDTELLKYIYINGEYTYFKLYDGKIKLVVD